MMVEDGPPTFSVVLEATGGDLEAARIVMDTLMAYRRSKDEDDD